MNETGLDLESMSAEQLASLWVGAKRTERAAQAERIEIEEALTAKLGGAKEEGSETHEAGIYKVTVTGKLSYKADMPMLLALCDRIPEHLRPIKTETKLDEAGAKYLRANDPELWRLISNAISISPAKTGLTVKEP